MKIFRLKDFPSFIRTTDPDDIKLNFSIREVERFKGATAIILNTFDDLEHDVIQSIKSMLPPVYSIGPLNLLASQEFYVDSDMRQIGLNLRREETECLDWLDTRAPNSWERVFVGEPTGFRGGGNGSTGVYKGHGGPGNDGQLVSSRKSHLPPSNRRILDALWVELDVRKSLWRCSDDMLAIFCGAANEL
ncbi:hypothetical protein YC2023_058576 [Brassica napus]